MTLRRRRYPLLFLIIFVAWHWVFTLGVEAAKEPAIQEEDFTKWGEGITEFLGLLQEGPSKSPQDFQTEIALLGEAPGKELASQLEEATGAFEEGKELLKTLKYKEANAKFRESANAYELALKGLPQNSALAAMVCKNLGQIYTYLMEWQRAEETLLKAMDIHRVLKNEKDLAGTYNDLGIVALKKGDKDAVVLYFEECAGLAKRTGSLGLEGACLGNLGTAYYLRGNQKKALQAYKASIKIQQKLGHLPWEARYLSQQALIFHHQGKLEQALHTYNRAIKIYREIGYKREEAGTLGNIGIIYNFQKKWEKAVEAFNSALHIHRELGLRSEEAKDLGNIGIVYQSQGRLEEALSAHKESLFINKILGNLRGEAKDLNNIAVIYQVQGEMENALKAYEEAYNVFLFLKSPVEMEVVKENIARVRAQLEEKR